MVSHAVVTVEEPDTPAPWSLRKLLRFMGPGLIMSIAYIDPGNLESDLQAGAITGYTLLWLLALTTTMGFIVQMQAARLGVVTGKNLAELCKKHYSRPASLILWLMAEVAIIGSDVQEVIGSALALAILTRGACPLWAAALVSAAASFLLLLVERAGVRQLEAVFAGFIIAMVGTFGYLFVYTQPSAKEVVMGFLLPRLPPAALPTAVALFGSLIMPHNIYLHSALVQSRGLQHASHAVKKDALAYFGLESGLALLAALFINMFVVCVFASGFHETGADVPDIGLQNAGAFLGMTYGPALAVVWGLGLLAAGQSSTMSGTYTGQFVMSGFLNLKVSPWARILITRSVALVPTLAVTLTMDPDSTQLDQLNQGLNLLQSIQLPFALIPVLSFTGCPAIMRGLHSSGAVLAAAWGVALLVICVNMTAVAQVASAWAESWESSHEWWLLPLSLTLLGVCYFGFLLYLVASSPIACLPRRWKRIPSDSPLDEQQQPLILHSHLCECANPAAACTCPPGHCSRSGGAGKVPQAEKGSCGPAEECGTPGAGCGAGGKAGTAAAAAAADAKHSNGALRAGVVPHTVEGGPPQLVDGAPAGQQAAASHLAPAGAHQEGTDGAHGS